jgi:hypothetical protein
MRQIHRRGFVLVLAIVAGMASLISIGFTRTIVEVRASNHYAAGQVAHYMAEAGTDEAMAWFATQGAPPACTVALEDCIVFDQTDTLLIGNRNLATRRIRITPADSNVDSYIDAYSVTSQATSTDFEGSKQLGNVGAR